MDYKNIKHRRLFLISENELSTEILQSFSKEEDIVRKLSSKFIELDSNAVSIYNIKKFKDICLKENIKEIVFCGSIKADLIIWIFLIFKYPKFWNKIDGSNKKKYRAVNCIRLLLEELHKNNLVTVPIRNLGRNVINSEDYSENVKKFGLSLQECTANMSSVTKNNLPRWLVREATSEHNEKWCTVSESSVLVFDENGTIVRVFREWFSTDLLLRSVIPFYRSSKYTKILVKLRHPNDQINSIVYPVIGPTTLMHCQRARIKEIHVDEHTIVQGKSKLLVMAKESQISIHKIQAALQPRSNVVN